LELITLQLNIRKRNYKPSIFLAQALSVKGLSHTMHIASGTHYASHVFSSSKLYPFVVLRRRSCQQPCRRAFTSPQARLLATPAWSKPPLVRNTTRFTHRLCAGPEWMN